MKIGAGLALICVGAILAFAVTANTSFFNLHTAGWVLMVIGVVGIVLPKSTYGWLGRRRVVRRSYPGGRVQQVPAESYATRTPPAAIQVRPTLLDQDQDVIEETRAPQGRTASGQPVGTEVVEDYYEQQ